jgi:hypothetical protein
VIHRLDSGPRKLLGQPPPVASAQVRTYIAVQRRALWIPVVGEFGCHLGGQPRGCWTGNLGGFWQARPRGGGSPWPTPTAMTPRCTGTSIPTSPRICGMASSGRTWTPATTRAPPRRGQPCPGRAGPAAWCCASASSAAAAWPSCRRPSFAVCGRIWALAAVPRGLGSRRAETTQSDYGRHLGSVPMIVLFVPHAAG